MPQYVPDSKTKRYVIISPIRQNRHESKENHACPFCPGNETMTPPEVFRMIKNQTEWSIRVVPNKYSITDIHEVFILSPQHTTDIPLLSLEHMQTVMNTFHARFMAHKDKGNVIIFGNHGIDSGASLTHPHAQLVVIPASIPFDVLDREPITHVIKETEQFVVYCPQFSQWPYEVWIAPKIVGTSFADMKEEERNAFGFLLQKSIQTLRAATMKKDFPFYKENKPMAYNYYISHTTNVYIRIVPRFIHRAGFELGTGLSVNTIPPEEAAAYIKTIWEAVS